MVIWRAWGILAFFYGGLAMMLFAGLASTFLPESMLPFSISLGLAIAALATWFTGQAMNVSRPQRKIDAWREAREQQLEALVSSGRFLLGPGQPAPASASEAHAQSQQLLEQELRQARRARNIHTFFFIPMQFWGFIFAAVAVLVLVLGIVGIARG
ncbi:hypothetical protein [Agrococcus sp. ARC_14]|uniref:hypothetical protein n=1 Tax=Agrococcus sp. ARC_14 TaxID=2919927 RepID=UPI001F0658D3|nr:hypothetical protein [Agrococcus sp. ARC_14]MCH1882547.1 hypothetical protein [Agrococcus sp. ARC_14]